MSAQIDASELLSLLDSTDPTVVKEIKSLILENLKSSREAWLLNVLVDSFCASHSEKCLAILASVSEPHDKHLFDRLLDFIKGNNKLQALTILGYIVRQQPPWLHKIVHHNILGAVIKCLKVGTDVPILMSGLLLITALLPIIPVLVGPILPDIFEVFSRLSAFNLKKPGNVPDVYLVHLQVGIYSLFHRLYGMYPCHFLTYLRAYYAKKENAQIFEGTIKPMLQRVRMHPMLVTASKDKETSRERWKQMEVHDIVVDCAKLSLDLTEGTSEDKRCPITGAKQLTGPSDHVVSVKAISDLTSVSVTRTTIMQSSLDTVGSISARKLPPPVLIPSTALRSELESCDQTWSPAGACGLSTPPPTPVGTSTKMDFPSTQQPTHQVSQTIQTPLRMTPHTRVPDSPLPVPHQDTTSEKNVSSASERHAKLQKRLSGFSLSLAGKLPTPTEGGYDSVPPSPLKLDFHSEPPLNVQKMQAIRKLSFQSTGEGMPREEEGAQPEPIRVQKHFDSCPIKGPPEVARQLSESSDVQPVSEPLSLTASNLPTRDQPQGPSVTQLPRFIDSLDHDAEMIDEEVSAIIGEGELHGDTSSEGSDTPSHLHQSTVLTAQSVANFMKNVNRIRFNSINVLKDTQSSEKKTRYMRSLSCPSLESDLNEVEDDIAQGQRSGSITQTECAEVLSESALKTVTSAVTTTTTNSVALEVAPEKTSMGSQTSFYLASGLGDDLAEQGLVNSSIAFPYEQLFPMTLPFAPFIHCYSCMMKHQQPSFSKQHKSVLDTMCMPLFSTYSPPDLLDRHIASGGEVHAKELSKIPLTSHGSTSWTHFGGLSKSGSGLPPSDEVTILRGQIVMLHNQLMFERHKRELHAKRNRRLLGSIAKHVSLEEQNSAMKDQLRLQETEINNLKEALCQQKKKYQESQSAKAVFQNERERQQRKFRQEIEDLQHKNKTLEEQISLQKNENENLAKELQGCHVQIFNLESDTKSLRIKSEMAGSLQHQVVRLNKELLLMGELQQKYQQRLLVSASIHNAKPETQFQLESYKIELSSLKKTLDSRTSQLYSVVARVSDMEETIKNKDLIVEEQKKAMEDTNQLYKSELQAVEEKYKTAQKIQQSLHAQILELHNQISRLSTPRQPSDLGESSGALGLASAAGASLDPQKEQGTSSEPQQIPGTFRSASHLHPVDSALDIAAMAVDSDSSDPLKTPE